MCLHAVLAAAQARAAWLAPLRLRAGATTNCACQLGGKQLCWALLPCAKAQGQAAWAMHVVQCAGVVVGHSTLASAAGYIICRRPARACMRTGGGWPGAGLDPWAWFWLVTRQWLAAGVVCSTACAACLKYPRAPAASPGMYVVVGHALHHRFTSMCRACCHPTVLAAALPLPQCHVARSQN